VAARTGNCSYYNTTANHNCYYATEGDGQRVTKRGKRNVTRCGRGNFFYLRGRGGVLNVKEPGMVNALMMRRRFFWTNTERHD